MKWPSAYLDWYTRVPKAKYDFRASGISHTKLTVDLDEFDFSINYDHGNPETAKLIADRYNVENRNVFISSEGTSGQNARVLRCIAELDPRKTEAVVELPTYEPLLRQVQANFRQVRRLERVWKDGYGLNIDELRKVISDKTGLIAFTNSHAPSGAIASSRQLEELMELSQEHDFVVFCDEIYAEFDRERVPTIFHLNREHAVVTTSYTKAYGLGGLKLGIALAKDELIERLYNDTLNTVGNSPNIVQFLSSKILSDNMENLDRHKQKWKHLRKQTEEWLDQKGLEYFPNEAGVTYWVKMPVKDTFKWVMEQSLPRHDLVAVPGAFFFFKEEYELAQSSMLRLGLGNINPDGSELSEGLHSLGNALKI